MAHPTGFLVIEAAIHVPLSLPAAFRKILDLADSKCKRFLKGIIDNLDGLFITPPASSACEFGCVLR
jgi:hypothetical protein